VKTVPLAAALIRELAQLAEMRRRLPEAQPYERPDRTIRRQEAAVRRMAEALREAQP
jgi:hypothetical protein